jgi:Fe-S-cluster containining protein
MICLRCGYCCREIWPGNRNDKLEKSEPCPHLFQVPGSIAVCKIYPNRPERCKAEHMGAGDGEPCMIGMAALERGEVPRPMGKCMYCGSPVYDGSSFCNEDHEKLFVESL